MVPIEQLLGASAVREGLKQAWLESSPGISGGHEEGGFIVRDELGALSLARWPRGHQDQIRVPTHVQGRIEGLVIVATFHTHPNTGDDYLQEPSETDKRAVRDDPDLQGRDYLGELVISSELIYLISPSGQVSELGRTRELLGES